MAGLKAYTQPYDPGYPRSLTDEQIEELLRPNLLRRFGKDVMLTGALLTGLLSSGCRSGDSKSPAVGNSEKPNEEVKQELELPKAQENNSKKKKNAKVEAAVKKAEEKERKKNDRIQRTTASHRKAKAWSKEVLGRIKAGYWNKHAGINLIREIAANPPLKYPRIEISYGNSYCGVFDIEEAKKITEEMFKIYGIELKSDVPVKGIDYEFDADGYNEKLNIGFEILGNGYLPNRKDFKKEALSPLECTGLNKDIRDKKRQIFVANINQLPNMDGDLYTPKQYYMASVIDYLNWVRGDILYKPDEVLGTFPISRSSQLSTLLPGSSFKTESAKNSNWSMVNKTSSFTISKEVTGTSLLAHLAAGDTLRYEPKEAFALPKHYSQYLPVAMRFALDDDKARLKKIQIKFIGQNGKTIVKDDVKFGTTLLNPSTFYRVKLPFKVLKAIEIKNLGDKPASFKVLDISVGSNRK